MAGSHFEYVILPNIGTVPISIWDYPYINLMESTKPQRGLWLQKPRFCGSYKTASIAAQNDCFGDKCGRRSRKNAAIDKFLRISD